MIDLLNIGPVPWAEDCAQVGSEDYQQRARRECEAFRNQMRRVIGLEPAGALLVIKSFPHDFGSYLEVCCRYSDDNETAQDYAFNCEGHKALERWDDKAWQELGLAVPVEIASELHL
jgi:hypothetical protein